MLIARNLLIRFAVVGAFSLVMTQFGPEIYHLMY